MPMEALQGLLAVGFLLLLLYGPWQWVCTDCARQLVFERRDAVFDLAADGKLSFESYEYRTIRRTLERSIRFAHELTLPRFLTFTLALSSVEVEKKSELRQAIERIEDEATRKSVEQLVFEAHKALILMMLAKSPLAMVFAPVVGLVVLGAVILEMVPRSLGDIARKTGELLQVEAERAPSAAAA